MVDPPSTATPLRRPLEIAATAAAVTLTTGSAWVLFGRLSLPDVAMLYLLGIVAVAIRFSLSAAILAAALSVGSYDFFFVPPYLSFRVDDARHLVTFAVMFVVGVVISSLTRRLRLQAEAARTREQRTARLYAMTRELAATRSVDRLGEVAARHLHELFQGDAVLVASAGHVGVVPRAQDRFVDPEQRELLETFIAQIAGALERARFAGEAEMERQRSSLLSSVSHDLRTPLAVITGAATTLLTSSAVGPAAQRDLLEAIRDESLRLTRLVSDLLDLTKLDAGVLEVNKEWQSIEAVVGAALGRVEDRLAGRSLQVEVPATLPLVPFDAVLVEQVLINLLENAAKYTPAGSPIELRASVTGGFAAPAILLEVADRGPGVPEPDRSRIFDKFHRVRGAPAGGVGLGLAICRGIVEVHGGRIWVADREGGGARFMFTLPIAGSPPVVVEEGTAP